MKSRTTLAQRCAALLLCVPIVAPLPGCGSLMFSQRHGQPPGKIDANVVIMDGIGLLFFILPGVVAFGIDFYTRAIYLPADVERGEGPFIWDEKPTKEDDEPEA